MKKFLPNKSITYLFLLINVLVGFSLRAATYYVSSSQGNDSYTQTQAQNQATPWKTTTKLNTIVFTAGDVVLFKRGDKFSGQINVPSYITYGAYGTGAAPIITGAYPITGWKLYKDNIYVAKANSIIKKLIVNGKTMTRARFPNTGFLTYDKGISGNSFSDAALSQPEGYWNGAHVRLSLNHWSNEMAFVTSYSGGTITYSPATRAAVPSGYTYYFDNKFEELDVEKEWYYDATTKQVYLYAPGGVDPSEFVVEGLTHNYAFKGGRNVKGVTIKDLQIEKQLINGVHLYNGAGGSNTVINNKFIMQMECGVQFMGDNTRIEGNSFTDIDGNAVLCNVSKNSSISNNTFKRIGMRIGYGMSSTSIYHTTSGITLGAGTSNFKISSNKMDSLGYIAIRPDGSYHTIERNIIKYTLINHSDGAAIYVWGDVTHHLTIKDNYIVNPRGFAFGQPGHLAYGIYLDIRAHHCSIIHNTIIDSHYGAILINAGSHDNLVRENTCFNNRLSSLKLDDWKTEAVYNNVVTKNVFYNTFPSALSLYLSSKFGRYNMGRFDSNYYCNPYQPIVVKKAGMTDPINSFSVDQWKILSDQDRNTKTSLYKWESCETVKSVGGNLITNGTFSSDATGWSFWNKSNSKMEHLTSGIDGGCVKYSILDNTVRNGYLVSSSFPVVKDKNYELKFSAKSTKNGIITILVRQTQSPYSTIYAKTFPLNLARTNYNHVFRMPETNSAARLDIEILYENSNFTIDNISLTPVNVSCHSPLDRSKLFSNPSNNTVRVDLAGKTYIDLNGNTITGSIALEPWGSKVLILASTATILAEARQGGEGDGGLTVYPNPGRSNITITSSKGEISSANLLDALGGSLIHKTDINSQDFNLNVSTLPVGVYLMDVKYTTNEHEFKRVIIGN